MVQGVDREGQDYSGTRVVIVETEKRDQMKDMQEPKLAKVGGWEREKSMENSQVPGMSDSDAQTMVKCRLH